MATKVSFIEDSSTSIDLAEFITANDESGIIRIIEIIAAWVWLTINKEGLKLLINL